MLCPPPAAAAAAAVLLLLLLLCCVDPYDPELMSEEVRQRIKAGEQVPVGSMKIPMVDLPLGATEDRVCGTIDIEKALTEGMWMMMM